MPHTYIIIFGVILFAAILTMFIPLGKYETKEITYTMNGEEKTRTVLDPDSFEYVLDENGNKVTKVAPLFGTEDFGGQGILNYVFEGLTTGNKNGTAVGIIAFILVVGGSFGIVLRTGAVESGIMRVINENLSNPNLTVEMITTEVGISRVHLHRKLKELTNQTTRDFIRNIRLKQAAELLSKKRYTIAEVADLTGFTNPNNFSTAFKDLYGMPPSMYMEQHLKQDKNKEEAVSK